MDGAAAAATRTGGAVSRLRHASLRYTGLSGLNVAVSAAGLTPALGADGLDSSSSSGVSGEPAPSIGDTERSVSALEASDELALEGRRTSMGGAAEDSGSESSEK